jgi:hypothetical protein
MGATYRVGGKAAKYQTFYSQTQPTTNQPHNQYYYS